MRSKKRTGTAWRSSETSSGRKGDRPAASRLSRGQAGDIHRGGAPADSADSIGAFYPADCKGDRHLPLHRPEVGAYAIQPIIK